MKFEIILRILFDLLSNKIVDAKTLATKYDLSVRTVYRYIDILSSAGVPVYMQRGLYGGIKIIDTYRLNSTFLTITEFDTIISSLSAINDNVPSKTIESIIQKIKSTKRNEYSGFDIRSENLIIDAGPWGDTQGYKSKMIVLQNSIENCNMLNISYHDRNGEITTREIEPHTMLFKQGIWYVYAFCHLRNDFRLFKVGRIEQANNLNKTFTKRELSKDSLPLDFFHSSVEAEPIVMQIDKSCLSDVEEWIGVENIQEIEGKNIAHATLPSDNGLVSKIMSFGNGVKVLSPESLKIKIRDTAKKILDNYSD